MNNKILLSLLCLSLAACAELTKLTMDSKPAAVVASDKYDPRFLQANLVKGKTTQEDVLALFGLPDSTDSHPDNPDGRWNFRNDTQRSLPEGVIGQGAQHGGQAGEAANTMSTNAPQYGVSIWFKNGVVQDWARLSPKAL